MKRYIGLAGGLAVCLLVWFLPLQGLPPDGQKTLALSLMAVVWWATGAMHPGYTALGLLLSYCIFLSPEIAPQSKIFSLWTTPTMYLVIGGFLIAAAVKGSGLGQRIALNFVRYFVKSYQGIIISCYVLGIILSFMIPHPWPRSFLLVSVMAYVIQAADLKGLHASNIGLAVFAGSVPTSMLLLTGDSTLNPAVANFSGVPVSWLQWLLYMGVPALLASCLTCFCQLKLFGKPKEFHLDSVTIQGHLNEMGKITKQEIKTICAIVLAVVLWSTDSLHGLHPGWVALAIVILLSTPIMGGLDASSWSQVNLGTLFFLTAAVAIGSVGAASGMNTWLADLLLPSGSIGSPYLFALISMAVCMALHLSLGSTLAVLSIASPAIVSFGISAGVPPLAAAMVAYTSVAGHWLFHFNHMGILVGLGEYYHEKEVFQLGICQTGVILVTVLFEIFWWGVIGIL